MSQPTAVAEILARMRGDAPTVGPLPDLREDPDFLQAGQAKQMYVDAVAAANADPALTDVYRAAAIVKAWNTCLAELARLRNDLDARRQARADQIGRGLPLGPGIPPGTSPADATVLRAAFTSALERARNSSEDDRRSQLADAERFGDDAVRRAVLTACLDDSQWNTVNRWAEEHDPAASALIVEWKKLTGLIAGWTGDMDVRFEQLQFSPPSRPIEVFDLPGLVAAHNNNVQARNASIGVRNGQVPASGTILDIAQLLA